MKKILLLYMIMLLMLCGCTNSPENPSPSVDNTPKIDPEDVSPTSTLSESTDKTPTLDTPKPEDNQEEGIITITSFDGAEFDGKLRMPSDGKPNRLVIYVNSSGPHTYNDHRAYANEFNYHDLFADNLTQNGVAYFSYNTRGVTEGGDPPYYSTIDEEEYKNYKPSNQIKDIEHIITKLREIEALSDIDIYLLGWSEGTFLAPLVAQAGNVRVDALLLAGYMNKTMAETLKWQQDGFSAMVTYARYFDTDGDKIITEEEYKSETTGIEAYLGEFRDLDINQDKKLEVSDFSELSKATREATLNAFENGDDEWLANNYSVRLTSQWYLDFANFPPNSETLPKLTLPIHIFHGVFDANVPVEEVINIKGEFEKQGLDNLTVHIYDDADHDLNYFEYLSSGNIPQGIREILDICIKGVK